MPRKRYSLPDGKELRPFGLGDVITNKNITDAMVEKLLETRPELRKVFIDADAQTPPPPPEPPVDIVAELEKLTVPKLKERYAELTGKPTEKTLKADIIAEIKYELDAQALLG